MRRIRSTTTAVLVSAVLAASLTGCRSGTDEQRADEVLIAADLGLSGAMAQVGTAYHRALELKVEQINRSGVLGDRRIRLEVRDNRSDPGESLRNIDDFTGDRAVSAIIMGNCDDCAVGAAQMLNERRVPAIALAPATAVSTPIAERRYLFKLAPNAVDSGAALTPELRRLAVRKVGLLHTRNGYGRDGVTTMTAELRRAKIRLARTQPVEATETDLSRAMTSLTSVDTDALIFWTSAEQAMAAAENARESGYEGRIFFDAVAAGELFLVGAADRSIDDINMLFTQTMVIDDVIATNPAKAARKQWFRDYTARFGGYCGFSSFAADAVQLLVNALTRLPGSAGPPNRDGIRTVLETSEMDGLSGPIRMTPANHSGLMPRALTMLVSRGGRWRLAN